MSLFGKSTLGLTYSLVFSEALLAPAIPSLAARAGWYLLAARQGALRCVRIHPGGRHREEDGRVRRLTTVFQTSTISSGMFITAMAANPLSVNLAASITGITITWAQWAIGAALPGLICLIATPLILYVLYPPEVKDSPEAPTKAKEELEKLGPMTGDEKIMAAALSLTVGLWVFGSSSASAPSPPRSTARPFSSSPALSLGRSASPKVRRGIPSCGSLPSSRWLAI